MNNDFLPQGYDIPASGGKYMRLLDGENRIRILASPIVGNEYWNHDNKPVRLRMGQPVTPDDVRPEKDGSSGRVKHFWAMPVWDYKDSSLKVLEITQNTLQKAVKELAADEDWGSPVGYDLVINRSGEGLKTEYGIVPKPAKKLDPAIAAAFREAVDAGFDLDALYEGGDPFTGVKPRGVVEILSDGDPGFGDIEAYLPEQEQS